MKRVKTDGESTSIFDPVHAEIRTAFNLKKAIDSIFRLRALGYCPTKVQQFRESFGLDRDESEGGRFKYWGEDEYRQFTEKTLEHRFRDRDLANQTILGGLKQVYKDVTDLTVSHTHGGGWDGAFGGKVPLRITHPGCEFDGIVDRFFWDKNKNLLRDWFEHSVISGYGDMQSLETKINTEVRDAHEILASEFEVSQDCLETIRDTWRQNFIPRNIRVESYKIHLYGPGGHFKSHRDTPERALVGTFLLGLGDTSSSDSPGHFCIGDETLKADPGSWVAFHPDVPHKISQLEDSYRAVIAFKIFRQSEDDSEGTLPAELEARVKTVLDQIPAPFGLFTSHLYSMGTTELNGFDMLLSAYSRSRKETQAHMLPVVTTFHGEAFYERLYQSSNKSCVYPLTGAHVDILLGKNVAQAKQKVKWLDGLSEIPFYTWDLNTSSVTWEKDRPPGANYTGNEADSSREDSIYLSYAILFLPQTSGSE